MPMLDRLCPTHGPFVAYRHVSSDAPLLCPEPGCGLESEVNWGSWTEIRRSTSADPVVVFEAPDGSLRFPGTADGVSARRYESQGYKRIELRGWADVRRFEGRVNAEEQSKIHRRVERQQRAMAMGESIRRSDLFNGIRNGFQVPERVMNARGEIVPTGRMKTVHLSARSRDIAQRLIDHNNTKRVSSYHPNFFVEAYSMDRGNRDQSRDERGRRRRD